MKTEEWLEQRMAYIKGLKKPSQQQELLLELVDKADRNISDKRKLAALVKAERADERAQKARAALKQIEQQEKAKQHKEETRKKILLGASLMADVKKGVLDWNVCRNFLLRNLTKAEDLKLFNLETKQRETDNKTVEPAGKSFFSGQ